MNSKENEKTMFKIMVDQKPFDWSEQFISGAELKGLASVDLSYDVWLKVNGPGEDIQIDNDEDFDLSKPGREHFFTGPTQTVEG